MSDADIDALLTIKINNMDKSWDIDGDCFYKRTGYDSDGDEVYESIDIEEFCSDWSATGPLMVEYGVSLQFQSGAYDHAFYSNDGVTIESSCNKNPLRAICEVILMMGNEK